MVDVAKLRELLDGATDAPWERVDLVVRDGNGFAVCELYPGDICQNDALIPAMRNALPELLDAAEELERAHVAHAEQVDEDAKLRARVAGLETENARLRACADSRHLDIVQAAAQIEAENTRLREALEPFAALALYMTAEGELPMAVPLPEDFEQLISRAAAVLKGSTDG